MDRTQLDQSLGTLAKTLGELAGWAAGGTLGEITLVVEGDQGGPRLTLAEAAAEVGRRAADGQPRSEAVAAVARESGLRRREVYDAVVAARRAGPDGRVLATDLSPVILERAQRQFELAGLTSAATRVMDGENLAVEPSSFDAVISRLGIIYLPDRAAALASARAALRPGGRLSVIVYGTGPQNGFFSVPVSIIRQAAGLGAPLPGQPGPFSLGADGVLAAELAAAGFSDIEVRSIDAPVRMPSAADCLRFERESFGALHQMLSGLAEPEREAAWAEVGTALAQFEGPAGFTGPCTLLVAAGSR